MTAIRMTHPATARTTTDRPASGFTAWRRRRPFLGGILLVVSGIEMFFSGQLDLGNIKIQMGFEGFQATVIPALLVLLGVLAIVTPAQRMFYGIFALILAVYSLVGVNLGGFVVGMLLGAVGGVMVVSWSTREQRAAEKAAKAGLTSTGRASTEPAGETAVVTAAMAGSGAPSAPAATAGPSHGHGGVVHAEAVDYAMLKARAAAKRGGAGGGSASTKAPAEPRPFASSRS
jgi:hypothetical protein